MGGVGDARPNERAGFGQSRFIYLAQLRTVDEGGDLAAVALEDRGRIECEREVRDDVVRRGLSPYLAFAVVGSFSRSTPIPRSIGIGCQCQRRYLRWP